MTYSSFETIISGSNPDRLLVIRRSLISILPRCALFVVSALVVGYINIRFANSSTYSYFRWLSLIPLAILLDLIRLHYNDLYIFSRFKLTKLEGRVSFSYSVPSINYVDIRGIVVSQSFLGRLLGYGDVHLGTASTDAHELVLIGMRDPEELAELIEDFRRNSISENDGE